MNFSNVTLGGNGQLDSITSLSDIFNLLINLLFVSSIALGVIFVIVAGIKFITSSGDEGKFKEARDTLFYSVIGIIVTISFRQIIDLALYIMGSGNLNSYLSQSPGCTLNINFAHSDIVNKPGDALSSIGCSFNTLIVALRHIVMALSLVFAVVSGIKYSTAAGDPEKLGEAQRTLTWAVIAALGAVFFWQIIVLVANIIGLKGVSSTGFEIIWDFDWLKSP